MFNQGVLLDHARLRIDVIYGRYDSSPVYSNESNHMEEASGRKRVENPANQINEVKTI